MEHPEIVTATEIAEYTFCPEAFRLSQLGTPSANHPQLATGTAQHASKANAERVAGGSIIAGRLLVIIALLGLVAWLLLS